MAVEKEGEIVVVTSGRGQAGGSTGSGDQVTNGNQRSGAEARCTQLQHRTIHRPWDLLSSSWTLTASDSDKTRIVFTSVV